jgi:hypothetical protein
MGKAELEQALERLDSFGPTVQQALVESPRYHDGCWMYIRVADPLTCQQDVQDIEQLILITKKPPRKSTSWDKLCVQVRAYRKLNSSKWIF